MLEHDDELRQRASPAELARHFPTPLLSAVGDEVADGLWTVAGGQPLPLALFDAVRVDYSLRRLLHYTGTDWRDIQPWILLTNYQRYLDQFVRWGLAELARPESPYDRLIAAGRRHRRPRRRSGRRRGTGGRRALAPVPDAGLPPHPRRRARRGDHRQHRRRARPTPRPSPTTWRCCGRTAG